MTIIFLKFYIFREWRPIANMSTRRSSVGVGVLGGLIYAVGGYDGNSRQCLSSVEVYSPDQDVWKRVADMSARRSGTYAIYRVSNIDMCHLKVLL